MRELIEGRPITHANFRLAHLLLNHTISNLVVTVNFDDYLSKALTLFGKPHIVCDHPQTVGRINLSQQILQIVHLHGSYWFYDCCNLRGELEDRAQQSKQTTSTMASLLDMILWDRSPLIIGYSGWEGDVFMEALRRRLARSLGSNVYWFCYHRSAVDAIPEPFKTNPHIRFVVPTRKTTSNAGTGAIGTEETAAARQGLAESVGTMGSSVRSDDEPTLPADTVLAKIIRAFELEAPELTRDPLGFYATRLDDSLPKGEASDTDTDIYAIKGVIERVRMAKQREEEKTVKAAVKPSESTLEQVRDALRRADYREAIKQGAQIHSKDLSTKDLEELADAMWSAAVGLNDNSEEEISAYDLVVNTRDHLSAKPVSLSPAAKLQVAQALYNKGVALGELNRSEEAILVYDEVLQSLGEATEPAILEWVASALLNKGVRLGVLNRSEEAILVYDEVLHRFGEATEPGILELVANALYNKGFTLGALNRSEEGILVNDEVVQRFGEATEPGILEWVAMALYNKGFTLGALNRSEEAILVYDEILQHFGETTEPTILEWVANALYNKGVRLGVLNRREEAIASHDEVIQRFGNATEPALRKLVAKASSHKEILSNTQPK